MKQEITETHLSDKNGNPVGGSTVATGILVQWQDGPLGRGEDRKEPNGAFVEGVIQAAIGRLKFYQASKFACQRNADAIAHLELALEELQAWTKDREVREVEGTHAE